MAPKKTAPAAAAVMEKTAADRANAAVEAHEEEIVALEVVPKNAGAVANLEDIQNMMLADSEEDLGFEKGDVAIPFFRVLQSNSPQVKRQNAKYVEDAEAGMFFNTATNDIYSGDSKDGGVLVVPVYFTKQATLWLPRGEGNTGGGFAGEIPMDEAMELLKTCTKNAKNKDITPPRQVMNMEQPQRLELTISAMYYILIINKSGDAMFETVAFPLTSTQMKKARTWNAIIKNSRLPNPGGVGSYRPAMFAYAYRLTTVPESNQHGDWMGVRIAQDTALIKYVDGKPQEMFSGAAQYYLAAREFAELVKTGKAKAKLDEGYEEMGGGDQVDGGSGDSDVEEDKPPF